MQKLNVSEIFYSLQGEGARAGEPSAFIRLQGCSAKHACYQSGILCDTEYESGKEMSVDEVAQKVHNLTPLSCRRIIWTGGEPLDQLTEEIVEWFRDQNFVQSLETSGVKPLPAKFEHVTISPKVAEHVLKKNFPSGHVTELRYVRHSGQELPRPSLTADYYYLSPHSDGMTINHTNLKHCIQLCLDNPIWRLSLQQHKIWGVL